MAIEITELISQLPVVFNYLQIFSYVILILFFGASALKGWKGFLPWFYKWPFRIAAGAVCLLVGFSIADYIPTLNTGIFRIFQSHIIAAGLVSAIIMGIALYLISIKLPSTVESHKREILRLQNKVSKMKRVKPNKVFMAAGIVIIAGLLVFAAINWKGFPPNMADELFSSLIPEGELPGGIVLGPGMSKLNPECMSIITLMQQSPEIMSSPSSYENDVLSSAMEEFGGSPVIELYKVEHEGQVMIFGLLENNLMCISTETEVCACAEQGAPQA